MREFFINADFDLSLRRGRDPTVVDARSRQAGEMSLHMLFLGIDGDTVLASGELDEGAAFVYHGGPSGISGVAASMVQSNKLRHTVQDLLLSLCLVQIHQLQRRTWRLHILSQGV